MTAKSLMILGALVGTVAMLLDINGIHTGIVLFAGGALFGKGYGIWENRALAADSGEATE